MLGISLRIDDELFPLELPKSWDVLAEIKESTIQEIAIEGYSVLPGQDVSLYFEMGRRAESDFERFWTSSPIHLPYVNAHPGTEMLFEDGFESKDVSR